MSAGGMNSRCLVVILYPFWKSYGDREFYSKHIEEFHGEKNLRQKCMAKLRNDGWIYVPAPPDIRNPEKKIRYRVNKSVIDGGPVMWRFTPRFISWATRTLAAERAAEREAERAEG